MLEFIAKGQTIWAKRLTRQYPKIKTMIFMMWIVQNPFSQEYFDKLTKDPIILHLFKNEICQCKKLNNKLSELQRKEQFYQENPFQIQLKRNSIHSKLRLSEY